MVARNFTVVPFSTSGYMQASEHAVPKLRSQTPGRLLLLSGLDKNPKPNTLNPKPPDLSHPQCEAGRGGGGDRMGSMGVVRVLLGVYESYPKNPRAQCSSRAELFKTHILPPLRLRESVEFRIWVSFFKGSNRCILWRV